MNITLKFFKLIGRMQGKKAFYKVLFFWLFSAGLLTSGFAQQTGKITLAGKVVTDSWEPLSYTHVMVLNSFEGSVTDEEGRFELTLDPSDTILFSRVGFLKRAICPKDSSLAAQEFMVVVMRTQAVSLQEVVVYANHPLLRSRGEPVKVPGVKSYEGPRIEPPAVSTRMGPMVDNSGPFPIVGMGVTYSGLLTAFASQFSKKEKEKAKYLELIKKNAERRAYLEIKNKKINRKIVKRALEISDEEADKFLDYFEPNQAFVLQANEYDMILAIMEAYDDYQRINRAIEPEN